MADAAARIGMQRISRALWVDVSPMRPHEFEHVELFPWIEAEDFQAAWKAGVDDANDEDRANKRSR